MLLHLTEASLWRGADPVYPWSTSGLSFEQVGFVHLSGAEQVTRVAEFLYREVDGELVVLELDESALRAAGVEVRWEDGGDGEEFPICTRPCVENGWQRCSPVGSSRAASGGAQLARARSTRNPFAEASRCVGKPTSVSHACRESAPRLRPTTR